MAPSLKTRDEEQDDPELTDNIQDDDDDEDITAEWVWEHLKVAFPQVKAPWFSDVDVEELHGGKNSEVYRIQLISDPGVNTDGLPSSVVKKRVHSWEDIMGCPPYIEDPFLWMARTEIRFYNEIVPLIDVKFPRLYWATPLDSPGPFDIFMEDLGKQHELEATYWPLDKTKIILQILAKIHSAMWAPKNEQLGWTKRFICKNTAPALLEFCRPVWQDFCKSVFVPKNIRISADFFLNNPRIMDVLLARPSTVRLYDLRQTNILKNQASEIVMVDPALSSIGLGVTDALHIIRETFTTGSREQLEKELLQYYWENLSPEVRATYTLEDLALDRDLALVENLLARTIIMSMLHPENRVDLGRPPKFTYPLRLALWSISRVYACNIKPLVTAKKYGWDWNVYKFAKNFDAYELARTQEVIERLKLLIK